MNQINAQLGSRLSRMAPRGPRSPGHRETAAGARSAEAGTAEAAPTLVAVAHGSRDPAALRTVTALLDLVRELRPGLDVRLGHIELEQPLLTGTLASLASAAASAPAASTPSAPSGSRRSAVLVPLLLGSGYHVKQDIPQAAAGFPELAIRVAEPLGPHPLLVETLYARLVEAGWTADDTRGSGVVLAAAGSRDPESTAAARRTAALLGERLGGVPVLPAYASAATPTVPAAVRTLTARGRRRVAIASYFTAPGRFASQTAAAGSWIAAAPLGAHPAMARLLLHRYDQARAVPLTAARSQLATA
nr:CbiX/SirB N-terminal domain-containing protein [Streptomyces sp. GC420]